MGEEKQDNLYHIHPTSVANLGCEYTCILYMALAATAAAAKASFQPQFRKEPHRATCFCSCVFWTLDMPFFHFQMTLLYFGLSLSVFSLVGGQTDVPSQPFWGEERNQGLLEKNHQQEELRMQQQNQQQPNLNATRSSNEEEPWPLRECIAILGLYFQNAIVFKFLFRKIVRILDDRPVALGDTWVF